MSCACVHRGDTATPCVTVAAGGASPCCAGAERVDVDARGSAGKHGSWSRHGGSGSNEAWPWCSRTSAPGRRTEVLFPPLGPALLSAHLKGLGVDARVFDGTFSSFDELIDDLVAWRPAIVGISAMVSLTAQRLAHRRGGARAAARRPAGGRRSAADRVPGPLPAARRRRVPRGGRRELPRVLPRLPARERATPATIGDLPLAEYAGLVADAGGVRVANPPVHHSQEEIAAYPLPDRDDFDHRAYQREWAPDRPPARRRCSRPWAVPTAASSAPSRSSATPSGGGRSTRSWPRSTTSSASATTACGSPTTPSHSTATTSRSSAGAWRRSG